MTLDLVSDFDVKSGKGTGRKIRGKKYKKYRLALENILPFLKESLEKSGDGFIRLKIENIAKEMGDEFKNKNSTSLFWGIKFILFDEGIVVQKGRHNDGSDLLIMRKRTENDILPPSLSLESESSSLSLEYLEK